MGNTLIAIIAASIALVVSLVMFPRALIFARRHHIVDNPNARKLQRRPVPVFGGIVVCSGILAGALLPFFLHNVFGQKSRMFIGDGGTLMLGMLIVVMTFYSVDNEGSMDRLESDNLCIPAFLLAVECIPLFDAVRVTTKRILHRSSPFKPDKTHLHHLFVDMGFSHLGAALFILTVNIFVVLLWLLAWQLGASMDVQMYVVIGLGILVTFGFYEFMKLQQNGGPLGEEGYPQGTRLWHAACKLGSMTHRENKRSWRVMSRLMDGSIQFKD